MKDPLDMPQREARWPADERDCLHVSLATITVIYTRPEQKCVLDRPRMALRRSTTALYPSHHENGETGSWLGMKHHGRGIGTVMRQALCAFMCDHLDAAEVTSAAFVDNHASLAVSRKVGYRENGGH